MPSHNYSPAAIRAALRHHWFPVARIEDLATPRPAELLGERLVVFRDSAGRPRVTARRCVHRGGDLAAGVVVEGSIQCPYHGWAFEGASGLCTSVPSLPEGSRIPPKARVRAYPVLERFGHVWTCLGEPHFGIPEQPDIAEIADLDLVWATGPPIPVDCGIMAQSENFRDVSHFPFVHAGTMGALDPVVPSLRVRRAGREVFATYFYPKVEQAEFSEPGASWFHFHSYAPGISTILADYGAGGKRFLVNIPCPVSHDRCVIFWALAVERTFTAGSLEQMVDLETKVYQEDAPVMNGLEPSEVPLAGEWEEASCPADAYTLSYRQATKFALDEIHSACLPHSSMAEDPRAANGHAPTRHERADSLALPSSPDRIFDRRIQMNH
jgi:phenylpropionate dioxygenase-like ring-hydroxylating dioxygenase large terminal subunit